MSNKIGSSRLARHATPPQAFKSRGVFLPACHPFVTIEVCGPGGWKDISLRADRDLAFEVASRRYRQRVAEQQARVKD